MAVEQNNQSPGVAAAELQCWQQLYDQGQFLKAYAAIEPFGPPEDWRQTEAQIFAGRLVRHLGARKRGDRLILRAWRHKPNDARAWYYKLWVTLGFRGPIVAWRELQGLNLTPESPTELQADYFSLQTRVLTELRDFERAGEILTQGEAVAVDRAWLALERAHWLEAQDRYAEALAACERGLELHPTHWACSGSYAHRLVILGKQAQAIAYLEEVTQGLESSSLVAQLATLRMETGQHAQAPATWERYPPWLHSWSKTRAIGWPLIDRMPLIIAKTMTWPRALRRRRAAIRTAKPCTSVCSRPIRSGGACSCRWDSCASITSLACRLRSRR